MAISGSIATALTIAGTAASIGGTLIGMSAQSRMIAEQTRASKRAENAREQQMQLDVAHRRRQSIRSALLARSMGLAAGTAQGAQLGTGVAAAMGNATSQGMENQVTARSSGFIGSRVFDANREYFDATQRGQAGMAFGQGLSALGGALVNNAGSIQQLGTYFGSRRNDPWYGMRTVG